MNKRQVQALKKKPWWNYALLVAAIFLYTEGCSLLYTNNSQLTVQIPIILFSMILHGTSLKDLNMKLVLNRYMDKTQTSVEKITKEKNIEIKERSCIIANIVMQILLITVAICIYISRLTVINILFLNITLILTYSLVAVISYKYLKKKI